MYPGDKDDIEEEKARRAGTVTGRYHTRHDIGKSEVARSPNVLIPSERFNERKPREAQVVFVDEMTHVPDSAWKQLGETVARYNDEKNDLAIDTINSYIYSELPTEEQLGDLECTIKRWLWKIGQLQNAKLAERNDVDNGSTEEG